MFRRASTVLAIVLAVCHIGVRSACGQEDGGRSSMDNEVFKNPPKEYRASPFWSWNDDLKNEELVWQVEQMKEQGFGGYFMHSRVGLITEYLSPAWMDRVAACLDAGKRIGMESWLYDEDKWPSGFAGGIVPAQSEEYRGRSLAIRKIEPEEVAKAKKDSATVAIFSVERGEGATAKGWKVIYPGKGRMTKSHGDTYVVSMITARKTNWYNGESYVDLLNPKVTEAFIKSTHDQYYKRFGKDFGEFMPGIFTDEPNYRSGGVAPWTEAFPEYFKKVNGYDLLGRIPLLFFDGDGCEKARHDFWRTMTMRFVESFTIPLSEWCEKHNSQFTGHYLSEETLLSQIRVIGAAMPHYEYMQLPGIDHLGRNISETLTLKQVSSAAHQFGRNRVLCEIFGVSGHSMSFEDMKWIADYHFALGITFMNQHLTLYSMKGERKRDFPPTISYHQPYWQYYRAVNDYFARCAYMLTRGDFGADILFLHPIGSAWATMPVPFEGESRRSISTEVMRYNDELVRLQDALLASHYDFDYGDEMIMGGHTWVRDGKLTVGKMNYRAVVMPPSLTWSATTVQILETLVKSGGHLVVVGQVPTMIDGEPSDKWNTLFNQPTVVRCENSPEKVAAALGGILDRDVSVTDTEGNEIGDIFYHHRACGTRHIYFLSSKNRERGFETTISVRGEGAVTEWYPADGTTEPVSATAQGGRTVFSATFAPNGSHIFVLDTVAKPIRVEEVQAKEVDVKRLSGPWRFKRTHLNSVALDYCRLSTQGADYSDWMPVWKVRRELARVFGMMRYVGIQPWALVKKGVKVDAKDRRVKLQYRFEIEDMPKSAYLILERAERFKIALNGKPVSNETKEWYWDKQFGKIGVTNAVAKGENLIELACEYAVDSEIEDMYVVGDFGVRGVNNGRFAIVGEPAELRVGSWTEQGYPFYAGNIVYYDSVEVVKKDGDRLVVRLIDPKGCLFKVSVNGREAGLIMWRPWEIDVTPLVNDGRNEIAVEVVGTLRNTMGPLHHKGGDLYAVGPGQFMDEQNWTDVYQFAPYGILGEIQLVKSE